MGVSCTTWLSGAARTARVGVGAEVDVVLGAGVAGRVDRRQATRAHLRTVVEE
ncbi:MAG: hypothetical protein ABW046_15640 [Actinoplanes sp.]